ncbi:MAG TPA: SRPBCC domain-containing protein, partial [Nevskia sp.]|nr:SRPBCC domain-containing protein [Nevskia sp.]
MDAARDSYNWALDREIVLSRVFAFPREQVFKAWTGEHIGKWFGPKGCDIRTRERNVKVGGMWRFDM